MKNILVLLGLKKENKVKVFFNNIAKNIKQMYKTAKKKKVFHKIFVIFMGLAFLATAILPYIL